MRGAALKNATEAPNAGQTLGRGDWIEAALKLLMDEGESAVRITRLAEALGVTRGGFYWHFKDRADLLDALLQTWSNMNTKGMVEAVQEADDLTSAVLDLFAVWIDRRRFDPRLDSALREWARRSEKVKRAVKKADDRRVEALARAFERAGFEPTEALIRARILYFTQVGYYALDLRETLVKRLGFLEAYFLGFTGEALDPKRAEAFRRRHLNDGKRK